MKKFKFMLLMAVMFLFGLSISANAYTLYSGFEDDTYYAEYYGTWSETYQGFYSSDQINPGAENWSGYLIGSYFVGGTDMIDAAIAYLEDDPGFTLSKTEGGEANPANLRTDDNIFGTWFTDIPVLFYGVKSADASTAYLYYLVDPTMSGIFTTIHSGKNVAGQQFELSHLASLHTDSVPVPEPGMIILLGIGLIGLAFFSRKRLLN